MIRSMTGFGRAAFELEGRTYEVEVRTVNHRHLDAKVRLPRQMGDHEARIKALVQGRFGRGKADLSVALAGGGSMPGALEVDREVAAQYVEAAEALARRHALPGGLDVAALMALPGVTRFVEAGPDPTEVARALDAGVGAALDEVETMRGIEGAALAAEFTARLATVERLVEAFEARSGEVVEAARERLRRRMEQIRQDTGLLDEARLHQEIVLAADRLDITEELVRLRSHLDQFRAILGSDEGPVGRRLDFLLQEMGRETNTVGSKANDAPLAHDVVELKTELERIREQVQNVE